MKTSEEDWIPVSTAIDELAERFFDLVADDWGAAYSSAWQVIHNRLDDADAKFTAQAKAFEWALLDQSGKVVRDLPRPEDGSVPWDFWLHFNEAKQHHSHGLVTLEDGEGAHSAGDDFWFIQTVGIVDGLNMRGRADGVKVRRSELPSGAKKPRKRGRPPRKKYTDKQIVERAIALIDRESITPSQAIAKFAGDMEGPAELSSKKKRLIRRLEEAGRWDKK